LAIESGADPANTISGFDQSDVIALIGLGAGDVIRSAGASAPFSLSISGDVVTQTFTGGAQSIYTFAITGESYDETIKTLDAAGDK
jgi:hypothetical protein